MTSVNKTSIGVDNYTSFAAKPDANGNITEYVDSQGSTVAHFEYSPFGQVTFQSGELADSFAYKFSTKYWDSEFNGYYYGYREYFVELARWGSRDPLGERGGRGLYLAARNNFMNSFDFLGLIQKVIEKEMYRYKVDISEDTTRQVIIEPLRDIAPIPNRDPREEQGFIDAIASAIENILKAAGKCIKGKASLLCGTISRAVGRADNVDDAFTAADRLASGIDIHNGALNVLQIKAKKMATDREGGTEIAIPDAATYIEVPDDWVKIKEEIESEAIDGGSCTEIGSGIVAAASAVHLYYKKYTYGCPTDDPEYKKREREAQEMLKRLRDRVVPQ